MSFPSGTDQQGLELPVPDEAAIDHSSRLVEAIIARIEQCDGAIGFDEYMQMALYQPGLGYYSGAALKFGAGGDFVTAPEISSLFGYCVARQIASLLDQGCAASILEFGAGTGKLCVQIMENMSRQDPYCTQPNLLSGRQRLPLRFYLLPELLGQRRSNCRP